MPGAGRRASLFALPELHERLREHHHSELELRSTRGLGRGGALVLSLVERDARAGHQIPRQLVVEEPKRGRCVGPVGLEGGRQPHSVQQLSRLETRPGLDREATGQAMMVATPCGFER